MSGCRSLDSCSYYVTASNQAAARLVATIRHNPRIRAAQALHNPPQKAAYDKRGPEEVPQTRFEKVLLLHPTLLA